MLENNNIIKYLNENRDICIEALRIYLGISLLIKGIFFATNPEIVASYANQVTIPVFNFLSIHILVAVHIAGGLLLTIGLITRVAALIQVPLLLGAVFFVHWQQGLFTSGQDLEHVILVLILLLFYVVYGGGVLSVDHILDQRKLKSVKDMPSS